MLTPEQKKLYDEVKSRVDGLDIEFLVKAAATKLVRMTNAGQVEMISKFIDAIGESCVNAAASAGAIAFEEDNISIDQSVDFMRAFIETSMLMHGIARLIDRAAESSDDGELGVFTITNEDIGPKLEEIRVALIRSKNEIELRKRRRR
jgi:hypothetical protein